LSLMKTLTRKSFTLIELLVVIAIIGLLSSVVLVSLSGPRQKAKITKALEFSQSVQHAIGNEAVGVWNFDDCTAKDLSGYGNNGTIYGATCVDDTPYKVVGVGQGKNALSFDGGNDYVSANANLSGTLTSAITVSAWIKLNDLSDRGIMGEYSNWSYYGYAFWISSNNLYFEVGRSGPGEWTGWETKVNTASISPGTWYHIVGTYNGSIVKLFVNSVEANSAGENRQINGGLPTCIGNVRYDCTSINPFNEVNGYFNGTIDDIRIYTTALTLGEIQQLYLAGLEKHQQLTMDYEK